MVISSILTVGPITQALDAEGHPIDAGGEALARSFPRFAADLEWWAEAGRAQRTVRAPPY